MGFLDTIRNLFHSSPPALDKGLGDARLQKILSDIRSANFYSTNQLLQELRQGQWGERALVCDAVSEQSTGYISSLDAWCLNEKNSPICHLVRGVTYISAAWEARGSGTSDTVSEEGEKLFEERLHLAEEDLLKTAALDPQDPTPYASLLTVARGLGQPLPLVQERFQAALERDSSHWDAHCEMLSLYTAKWGGSHESMFAFARAASTRTNDDSLDILRITAHIERWLYFFFSNNEAGAEQYLKQPEVQAEALAAFRKFQTAQEKKSRLGVVPHKNIAAFWFYLIKDTQHLKPLLEDLGLAITSYPWKYSRGDASVSSEDARKLVGIS